MKNFVFIVISTLISSVLFAQETSPTSEVNSSQVFMLQKSSSTFDWTGKAAFNAYSQQGTLKAKSGKIQTKDDKVSYTKIVIDMTSLSSENKDLTKHLKNKDFFEVKKYKTATFLLTRQFTIKEGTVLAKGNLTIKNITKPYTMPLKITKTEKGYQVEGIATIDRTEFGVSFNSTSINDKIKENAIADDFSLKFKLNFE